VDLYNAVLVFAVRPELGKQYPILSLGERRRQFFDPFAGEPWIGNLLFKQMNTAWYPDWIPD
jgi:hypothetical protein